MKRKHFALIGIVVLSVIVLSSIALANSSSAKQPPTLPEVVRQATMQFKDTTKLDKAGYALLHGCVSGPQEGAMGIHYANGQLVGDGKLDVMQPEALLYEPKDGKLQLLGVEYIVDAVTWNAKNQAPPVLMGQLFNYVSAPNRYGIPAFFELHVWAWRDNPDGVFADWNPRVTCEQYVGNPKMTMDMDEQSDMADHSVMHEEPR